MKHNPQQNDLANSFRALIREEIRACIREELFGATGTTTAATQGGSVEENIRVLFQRNPAWNTTEIVNTTNYDRKQVESALNRLVSSGFIRRGKGVGTWRMEAAEAGATQQH